MGAEPPGPPIFEHLKPYVWTEKLEEQTVTIVANRKYDHPRQIIEAIRDFNHEAFSYNESDHKKFEDIFNTHVDVFYIACKEVSPHVFVLLENNGYYANQEENVARLSDGGDIDPEAVAISLFWNVNARYSIMIGSEGKCIFNLDPFDVPGSEMTEANEAAIEDFGQVWKWGKDIFVNSKFQNMEHILPGMFWLAEILTGYRITEDLYTQTFDHIGSIGGRKKRRTEEEQNVTEEGTRLQLPTATPDAVQVSTNTCEGEVKEHEEDLQIRNTVKENDVTGSC